ncbi:hypothetical protein G7Y79_00061g093210 [Physcia stellaris]|nr:hypothetical protein G7Y79_00061g093210 [Physcia stellaris]
MCPLELEKVFKALKISWTAAPRFLAIINLKNPAPFRCMPGKALASENRYRPTIESLSDSSSSASSRVSSPRSVKSQATTASSAEDGGLHGPCRADALLAAVRDLRKDMINFRMPESSSARIEKLMLTGIYTASQTPRRVVLAISRLIQNPFLFDDEEIIIDYLRSDV